MSLFLLAVAFVLTGINQASNKALIEFGLGRYTNLYLMGFWGVGVVIGFVVKGLSKHCTEKHDVAIGLAMGVMAAFGMIFLMTALKSISGVVAFPVRSCANVALTAGLSYMIWKEDLALSQWLGIGLAVVAIYLLV